MEHDAWMAIRSASRVAAALGEAPVRQSLATRLDGDVEDLEVVGLHVFGFRIRGT